MSEISKDSIEAAYCFFHQKWQVYRFSGSPQQKDEIEYAISLYVDAMSAELYSLLAAGQPDFLLSHASFAADMASAVGKLEDLMK